jgi:NAD(P)-dependent dehydrogenase (short-subunit alcohol dehydrogenase family)
MERRNVLVTGIGSGLGAAIAARLARAGDAVVGTVRDPERARAMEADNNGNPRVLPLELGNPESVQALAARVIEECPPDVVVQNAGFGVYGSVEEVGQADLLAQFQVNVFGPLQLLRLLLPALRERKGRVIFVGSLADRLSMPYQGAYSATKSAIASFSDALRMELKPFGVRVTCVEPADFVTGFTDARRDLTPSNSPYLPWARSCLAAVDRTERQGASPEDVASLVERISRQKSPPARVFAGHFANSIVLLHRTMPDFVRESIVMSTYGLKDVKA